MTTGYAFRGSERLVGAVADRLAGAGLAPVADEAAADVVITFATTTASSSRLRPAPCSST